MKRITLLARDIAPSDCFIRLRPALESAGHSVTTILGSGSPITNTEQEIREVVLASDLLVLGMSFAFENADMEVFAGSVAKEAEIPYGFYGDVPGCWWRAGPHGAVEGLADGASFYFGTSQEDAEAARKVFPSAVLIGTGNPLRELMAFPRFSRDEIRGKLGIRADETLVLAPGGKFAAGNAATWVVVMDALARLQEEHAMHLVLTTHPGDKVPRAIDPLEQNEGKRNIRLYDELVSLSPIKTSLVHKDVASTSDIVPGADIIIEFGSSVGIEGAFQGIPVITLEFQVLSNRNKRLSGETQSEAVREGISVPVRSDASALTETIRSLLSAEGSRELRERQSAVCPKPKEKGEAILNMVIALSVM